MPVKLMKAAGYIIIGAILYRHGFGIVEAIIFAIAIQLATWKKGIL